MSVRSHFHENVSFYTYKFSDNVIEEIQNKLQDIRNPVAAMMVLLREMDLETDSDFGGEGSVTPGRNLKVVFWRFVFETCTPRPVHPCVGVSCYECVCFHAGLNTRINLSQLYGSSSAMSVICQAVCHMSMTRALFCRDLLILQKLYLRFGDNVRRQHNPSLKNEHQRSCPLACVSLCASQVFLGGGSQLLQLQQDQVPRSSHMLTSYHLLKHISQSLASSVPVDIM